MRESFEILGNSICKKMQKELERVINIWKDQKYPHRKTYEFIERIYKKMLSHCPLYEGLKNSNRIMASNVKEFAAVDQSRDESGRALKLKSFKNYEENECASLNYGYVRQYILKVFIISSLSSQEHKKKTYEEEYKLFSINKPFLRKVFTGQFLKKRNVAPIFTGIKKPSIDSFDEFALSSNSESGWEQLSTSMTEIQSRRLSWDECIPKSNIYIYKSSL